MADDYLGKKMENYLKGNIKRTGTRRLTPAGNKPGTLSVKFPPRRVFVTGGASGIGRAIVKALTDAGCRVAFCDNDLPAGRDTSQATASQFHPVDVTDAEALDNAMQRVISSWGGIDVVVNNVGISGFKPITECSVQDFDRIISTNLRPVFITAKRLAAHRSSLQELTETARIINISSTRARMSEPESEAYAASKGGIESLTHSLMASLAHLRVTVNCIAPGWINCGPEDEIRPTDHTFHPSGRVGVPADIAAAVLFLCSPEADFINGQTITIDGGVTHKMIYPE